VGRVRPGRAVRSGRLNWDARVRGCDAGAIGRREVVISGTPWTWARLAGGAAILGVLAWRLGTGPFLDGLRVTTAGSLAAGAGIGVLTTVCCGWRWRLVAAGLGLEVPIRTAVAACYRSQFLNATLPGGVLGDVDRAMRHGHDAGDLGRSLRAVAWERAAGQAVQLALTLVVLAIVPFMRFAAPPLAAVLVVGALGLLMLGRRRPGDDAGLGARVARVVADDIRRCLLASHAWPGIMTASILVSVGHATTFLIAARPSGISASPTVLVSLALVVLLASAVPANLAGWGPREGAAAWAFGAVGLGASQGVATAVVYGVMVPVASLPGAALPVIVWLLRGTRNVAAPYRSGAPGIDRLEGAARG
jgi:uncharacterized membrane protein YbhN (UPF0104 family)